MAKPVDESSVPAHRKRELDPWGEWFDGRWWELSAEDMRGRSIGSLRSTVSTAATRRGKVASVRTRDGRVFIRAVDRED